MEISTIAILTLGVMTFGWFLRIEHRLTKIETIILNGFGGDSNKKEKKEEEKGRDV
jgi:hypothetical protein